MVIDSIVEEAMAKVLEAMKALPDAMKLQEMQDLRVSLSFHMTWLNAMIGMLEEQMDDDDFDEEDF
jgi:hypothetical protein